MVRYDVMIEVLTAALSLSELSEALGMPASACSHEIGDPALPGRVFDRTYWRATSLVKADAPLEEHLRDLFARFPLSALDGVRLPGDTELYLSIAVFHDEPMCRITLRPEWLLEPVAKGFRVEVTSYTCSVAGEA